MMAHALRLAAVILLAVVIAACTFKTVYNNLDYLIPEYVEGLVSLDDILEDEVDQRTLVLLDWHRNTQLKPYAEWLRSVQRDAGPTLTEETVIQRILDAEDFWRALAARLNQEMAYLLPRLNADQRRELFSSIKEKNAEYREAYIDIDEEERLELYREWLIDNYANWIGDLTVEQEDKILQASMKLAHTAAARLQRRMEWQQGISEVLEAPVTTRQKSEQLSDFMAAFENIRTADLVEKTESNKRILVALTVGISHSMTDEQMDHFIDKTDDYIRMFVELSENR